MQYSTFTTVTHPFAFRRVAASALATLLIGASASPTETWRAQGGGARARDALRSYRLDNGVRVVIAPMRGATLVAANLTVAVGALEDPPGSRGMAHLLEHATTTGVALARPVAGRDLSENLRSLWTASAQLVALRSQRHTGQETVARLRHRVEESHRSLARVERQPYAETLERSGAIGLNATTSWDVTQYFAQFPAHVLPQWLQLEADRLQYPLFDNFESERDAAQREAQSSPDFESLRPFFRELFGGWDGLHAPFGAPADIARIDLADAVDFMRRTYRPDRIVVTLVGDVDPEHALRLCRRVFGSWRPTPEVSLRADAVPGHSAILERVDGQPPHVLFAVPRNLFAPSDAAALEALAALINSEPLSPLSTQPSLRAGGWQGVARPALPGLRGPSVFAVLLYGPHGTPGGRLSEAVLETIRAVQTAPDEELRGAILLTQVKLATRLEDPPALAAALGLYETVYRDSRRAVDEVDAVFALTPDTLRRTAARLVDRASWRNAR